MRIYTQIYHKTLHMRATHATAQSDVTRLRALGLHRDRRDGARALDRVVELDAAREVSDGRG